MFPIREGGTSDESANNIEGTSLSNVSDIGGKRYKALLLKLMSTNLTDFCLLTTKDFCVGR